MALFRLGKLLKGRPSGPDELRRMCEAREEGWEDALVEALGSKDPELRAVAAGLAKLLPAEVAKPHLMNLLRDPYRPTVMAALDSIAALRITDAAPVVSGLLGTKDQSIKEAVARCLARIGGTGGASAILDLLDVPRLPLSAERAVTDLGATAIPTLMSALLDGRAWVRQNAALLLGRFGDRRAVPSLMVAVNDADPGVRVAAVNALGALGGPDAVAGLIGALGDAEETVRIAAVTALGAIRDPRAVVPLVGLFSDPVRQVRDKVVKALADIGSAAIPSVLTSLREADPGVREYAAKTLGFVSSPEALEPLLDALEDGEWAVRRYAAEALGKLGSTQAIPYLLSALHDPIDFVRERARQALDRLDPSGEVRKLVKPSRRKGGPRGEQPHHEGRKREPGAPGTWTMDLPEAYAVLGLGLDATRAQVRAAWKELMRTLHPDAVAHLSAEEKAKAEEEAKRVNVAYEVLMKALPE